MLRAQFVAFVAILIPCLAVSEDHLSHKDCHLQVQPWRMFQWSYPVVQKYVVGADETKCGFRGGEVFELQIDPKVVSYERLSAEAQTSKCARRVNARNEGQHAVAREVFGEQNFLRTDDPIRLTVPSTKHRLRKNNAYGLRDESMTRQKNKSVVLKLRQTHDAKLKGPVISIKIDAISKMPYICYRMLPDLNLDGNADILVSRSSGVHS